MNSMFDKDIQIKLVNKEKLKNTGYSLCYLKKNGYFVLGMDKVINLYDTNFKLINSANLLTDKISYIYELKNGNILVTDLNKTIKILKYSR